jgi:hypothetical protein
VYDMYPWDKRPAADPARTGAAIKAVQIALDRRDNGGDATPAAGPALVGAASTPTASPTRQ